jgi:uncharacterized membrane protein
MPENFRQQVIPPSGHHSTGTGLNENIAATLCYAFLPAPWVGGIVMFLLEPDRRFVRFHAAQSILAFGLLTLVAIVLGPFFRSIPYLGYLITSLFGLGWFVLWLLLLVRSFQEIEWRLPVLGSLAARWAGR